MIETDPLGRHCGLSDASNAAAKRPLSMLLGHVLNVRHAVDVRPWRLPPGSRFLNTVPVLSIDPPGDIQPDQVVDLDLGFYPAPSGSGEILFHADAANAVMILLVVDRDYHSVGPAIVTFVRCSQSVFGYPNDEATRGDPRLRNHGYGFHEIRRSPWAGRLQAYNRRAFPEAQWSPMGNRHFVVTCHENTAQFLADDIRIEPWPGPFAVAVQEVCERLLG